jgi:two-component system, OmpR family, sensor histidine kinase VicK
MSNFHRDNQPNNLKPEFQIDQQILQKIKEYTVKFTNLSPELQTEAIAKLYLILKGEEELRKQNLRSQLLAQVTHKIRQSLQLTEILATAVTEVKKLLQVDRVLIVKLANDSKIVVEQAECFDCPTMLGEETSQFLLQADYLQQYRQGKIVAISDLKQAIATLSNIELNEELGVKASLVAPIFVQEELWGVLILHQCHIQRVWQEFDIDLSKQLADQIGIAMTQSQLLEHLEKLVIQRTEALTTTNKQLQQEINDRQQAQENLRRSEEQLRLITDTLPVLIAYIDFQQRYRFINRTYEQWWGKPISEIKGKQVEEIVGEEIYQQIKEYIEMALLGQRVTFEMEISHKDGSDRWMEATYIPHIDERGRVKGLFGLITDLTERKSIERMKDEFISVVSHELRTPLTSIHGSLKLLATGRLGNLSEEGQQMLAIADENTDRLVRLVNDVLDLQRMQSGKVKIEKRICNAADLMRQAIEAMQGTAQQQRITLLNTPAYIQVWADPDYIVQVLINLLSNAIKFSFPGDSVWMRAEARDNEIIFQVQDYGQGIPKDKLETIFACFQQVDASDSRTKGGTGLGLAICRQIVELHQGKIWAESTLGKGSTFYFTLMSPKA